VIHTVGALLEGFDYKSVLSGKSNPLYVLSSLASGQGLKASSYEESLEAKNRDSCKLIAEHYNNACKTSAKKGHFVFISAAPTIAPVLSEYIKMKEQAESFLLNSCPDLTPVILKPGLVWHENERAWSLPFKFATDFGYQVNKKIISHIPGNQVI